MRCCEDPDEKLYSVTHFLWLWTAIEKLLCPAESNKNQSQVQSNSVGANADIAADLQMVDPSYRTRIPQGVMDPNSFQQWINHPVKVYHTNYNAASTDTVITQDLVLLWQSAAPAQMLAKFQNLYFFETDIDVEVVVQGCQFAQGMIVLAFIPRLNQPMLGQDDWTTSANRVNGVVVPHVKIDPSKSCKYKLKLPMPVPNGFYTPSSYTLNHGSYAVHAYIYNPIGSGTSTAANANVCIYASFSNVVLHGMTHLLGNPEEESSLQQKDVDPTESRPLSFIADAVQVSLDAVGTAFPVFQPATTIWSKMAAATSGVLKWLGFAKPVVSTITAFVTNRNHANYTQADGENTSYVLGRSQTHTVGIDPKYGLGKLEDMTIDAMCAIPAPVIMGQVLTFAAAAEAFIFAVPISPVTVYTLPGPPVLYHTTPLAGAALPFTYWRGDIDVTFEFVASIYHRETVLIAWDPFATNLAGAPTYSIALTTLKNQTVQISGNTSVTIAIPYMQPMPMEEIGALVSVTSNAASLKSNGVLYIYCTNPVQTNGSTDPITCNVYFSSKNMAFSTPDVTKISTMFYRTELLGSPEVVDTDYVAFGAKTDLSNINYRCTGDVCHTVKEVTSRMTTVWRMDMANTAAGNKRSQSVSWFNLAHFKSTLPTGVDANKLPVVMNFLGYFAPAFNSIRGSIQWSFAALPLGTGVDDTVKVYIQHLPRSSIATPFVPTIDIDPLAGAAAAPNNVGGTNSLCRQEEFYAYAVPQIGMCSQADVIAPMIIPTDFLSPRSVFQTYNNTLRAFVYHPTVDFTSMANITSGSGDDMSFGWFLGFPILQTSLT